MLARQLALREIKSCLIEGGSRAGRGVAYSTDEPSHLLNVRAEAMSAWPDAPDHFAQFIIAEGGSAKDFVPRRRFGLYLDAILGDAIDFEDIVLIEAQAVSAEQREDGWRVELDGAGTIVAHALVLAIGNQPPEPFADGIINNPWNGEAKAAVREAAASGGDVLLIGTGLTMIDTVLSLEAAGHRGRIVALSRRGQIPKAHAQFEAAPVEASELPGGDLLGLWRWLRRRSAEVGWRAAVDSLRPHSHWLWQGLNLAEQRRFLRHARPWWDVHRHRIAPEVARQIVELVAAGRLEIVAGRIGDVREADGGLEVEIRRRAPPPARDPEGAGKRRFAFVFNCTGPLGAIERSRDPLLRRMLVDGLVRPDPLGLALDVDERSRAAGAERLWALGPLTKGRYWEIVAVPDIREQTAAVAADIAGELSS